MVVDLALFLQILWLQDISEIEYDISLKSSPLSLPVIDDFSIDSYYPDTNIWQDKSVFINRNYAVNPITIGVATFDGLDARGRPYDITLTGIDSENADTLTSHKIDLSSSDTVYLMFF